MKSDSKNSVLIIDDESSNLAVLNKILSSEYTVLTAKSGDEGMRRAGELAPDLILMDIVMPGISGFEALDKMKKSESLCDIPVIIITGLRGEDDEEKGFLLGAVDYITKPFRSAIVLARVRTHMKIVNQLRTIESLSFVDSLTGIPNRRTFDNRLDMEWRRCAREGEQISMLMIDVDRFKVFNDTYGHPQGDELLKGVARIIAAAVRRPTDLAARVGGEEFSVLLPETDKAGAAMVAEKIRSTVNETKFRLNDGSAARMTVSVGVATATPGDNCEAEDMVVMADKRLYEAKNTGRNRVCG